MLLCQGLADPQVLGVGGAITPLWKENEPAWFPEEFYWVIGCTYRGMPQTAATIRNLISANMAMRREVFDIVGGFRSDIGRIGKLPIGCEETELCIRAHQHWPQSVFLYLPEAKVFHNVPTTRIRWRYFCSRCYAEGLSKATLTGYVGVKDTLATERVYTFRTLPLGIIRGLTDAFLHLDLFGLVRAVAITVGLAITTTGYLIGRIFLKKVKLKIADTRNVFPRNSKVEINVASEKEAIQ